MIKYSNITDYSTKQRENVVVGVGTTLFTRNESVRVMSDIWEYQTLAYYWTGKNISSVTVSWEYQNEEDKREVVIDADLSVVLPQIRTKFFDDAVQRYLNAAEKEANDTTIKGRIVKVMRGRTNRALSGKVVAVCFRNYGVGYYSSVRPKIAIALDNEMTTFTARNGKQYPCHKNVAWVWAHNCDVVNPVIDMNEIQKNANSDADSELSRIENEARAAGCN